MPLQLARALSLLQLVARGALHPATRQPARTPSVGCSPSSAKMPEGAEAMQLTISQSIDVEDVISAAEDAGRVILGIYNSSEDSWGVEVKSDNSPLTRADRDANELICSRLQRAAPHVPIVSEENRATPYAVRAGYQYFWCVDPLDGTKEFIKRNGQFTVNIALVRKDTPVLGVVHTPCQGRTHWAVEGRGAYVREGGKGDAQIHAAEFSDSDPGLTLVGSSSHTNAQTEAFVARYREPKFSQLGSSLKLLLVAEGRAHVYPRLAPTSEWDTAAAHVVVTEAGGSVVQAGACDEKGAALEDWGEALGRGRPVVYNKESPLNPYFVVYGKRRAM